MGLVSFVQSAGRKLGTFGGDNGAAAPAPAAAAAIAQAAAAQAQATADMRATALHEAAVTKDIAAAILGNGVGIADLAVAFAGTRATLNGTAKTQADREKAVLIAGNTAGVAEVDDRLQAPSAPASVYHTVVAGDTLSKIAGAYYGSIQLYQPIFEANQPMLAHPDKIYPGQVLRLPPVAAPTHTVAAGETLGAIAKRWYGDPKRYTEIFEANRGALKSADAVAVGQQLKIPLTGARVPLLS